MRMPLSERYPLSALAGLPRAPPSPLPPASPSLFALPAYASALTLASSCTFLSSVEAAGGWLLLDSGACEGGLAHTWLAGEEDVPCLEGHRPRTAVSRRGRRGLRVVGAQTILCSTFFVFFSLLVLPHETRPSVNLYEILH